MSAVDTLRALAGGQRPASGLLHTCRFDGLGQEIYGEEAILARLGLEPFNLDDDALIFEEAAHIAVLSGQRAFVADLYDGSIARLWLLGPDSRGGDEAQVSVAFDPDLAQVRGDVFFAASDHPTLAPDAADRVLVAGRGIVAAASGQRTRAFAIRAFGDASTGAALFAIYRLHPEGHATAGFVNAVAFWRAGQTHIVRDLGGEAMVAARAWTPFIRA
jgi:hypothetical protein